jgi:site-specific recombinase XerD
MDEDPTVAGAIERFSAYVKATQSRGSARAYAVGLRHLQRYLAAQDPPVVLLAQVEPQAAADFIPWMYEHLLVNVAGGDPEKVRPATLQLYLAAATRFFEWLVAETRRLPWTMEQYDVLRRALRRAARKRPRDHLSPNKLPSAEIVAALLQEARQPLALPETAPPGEVRRQELARLRDIAMVETLASSGVRVGELVRLERGDLLHETRGAYIRYAKGGKEREVLFSKEAWAAIHTYLEERDDRASVKALGRLPLFARHDRRSGSRTFPLGVRSVERVIENLARRAGILERFNLTPHSLRHFFATEFLSETGDLALTQFALGHSSPTTTRIYAQTKVEDYRRAYREKFEK